MGRFFALAVVLTAMTAVTAAQADSTKLITVPEWNQRGTPVPNPGGPSVQGAMHNNMMPVIAHPAFDDGRKPFTLDGSACAYCTGHDGGVGQLSN
jgi:hypothetical protein